MKMTSALEREVANSKLDLKQYDHSLVWKELKKAIEKGIEGEVSQPIMEVLEVLSEKGAPDLKRILKEQRTPMGRTPQKFISPMKLEMSYDLPSYRQSMVSVSAISSAWDETIMTDIGDFLDSDKVEIYKLVDDLIKFTEAQEIISQSTSKLTPTRPFSSLSHSSTNPFSHPDSTSLPSLSSLFSPPTSTPSISSSLISQIHLSTSTSLSSTLSNTHPCFPPSDSLIQRLSSIKKLHSCSKSSLHSLLFTTHALSLGLAYLANHLVHIHTTSIERANQQIATLLHALGESNKQGEASQRRVKRVKEREMARRREEKLLMEYEGYENTARIIQRAWRSKISKFDELGVGQKQAKEVQEERKKVKSGYQKIQKLKETQGSTGKFLIMESMKHTDSLMDQLLHWFVFKTEGFTFDTEEFIN
jgi:hypothetical protein